MPQEASRKKKLAQPLVFPAPIPDTLENVTKSFFQRPKNKPWPYLKKDRKPTEGRRTRNG